MSGSSESARSWQEILPPHEREVFETAGYGTRRPLGSHPAVLVVDVTYAFTGPISEPLLDAAQRIRTSCGERGWRAVPHVAQLIEAARTMGTPIIYSRGRRAGASVGPGRWRSKNRRADEDVGQEDLHEIVEDIAPMEGDMVLEKSKPSVFFGTDLLALLIDEGIDTLVVAGGTTSGCVRATVVDAFSYNFHIALVEEATFDRSETSHLVNLFDMNAKYADVIPVAAAVDYIRAHGGDGASPHSRQEDE